jgi:hypothetical protein
VLDQSEQHLYFALDNDPPLVRQHFGNCTTSCRSFLRPPSFTIPVFDVVPFFSALTCDLYSTMKNFGGVDQRKRVLKWVSIVLPTVLLLLAYFFDSEANMAYDDPDIENGILNVARHSFSCSMRFQNSVRSAAHARSSLHLHLKQF